MPEEKSRGRFVWFDVMTTDLEGAKRFYGELLGWGTSVWEGPEPYTMWTRGETPLGGVVKLPGEAVAGGSGPHWLAYVTVPDADAAAARARELGAKILVAPEDIPGVGRFTVFQDPQGASLSAIALDQEPPESAPAAGDLSWHELATTDRVAAFNFYSGLFGWEETESFDMGPDGLYQMYGRAGRTLGGIYQSEKLGPAWLHYVRVDDVDRAAEKVRQLGGQVATQPMEVPGGDRIAVCLDPQGARFAVHQLAEQGG